MPVLRPKLLPGPMKRMSRVLEKLFLVPEDAATLGAALVCDIVRGMGEAADLKQVSIQIDAICNHPEVIALRMKER